MCSLHSGAVEPTAPPQGELYSEGAGTSRVPPLLPAEEPRSAKRALSALVAMDAAGLVLGWRLFDHAAHLGGALFGIWYVAYGHKLLWRKRERLVKLWHGVRSPGGGGSGPGG
ncbi:Presenilins-associated rhomboid-like protein, mitochondrial [Liparis tanakae]|uniref:Presenilins-associated rhomboid-like protein, mitochondrial n=1 Tax=Liparis tanakae TaxID=230148 RepID=A0A4Z2FHW9_9TELE|nr:Presenilins-associated rhomboid-like protein, mitochondrial [Liparis tanakae]